MYDRPPDPAIASLLRETFGFESLRPGQSEAIDSLLKGKSVLTIFPTGGGKSLCYQLPALCLPGLTLVISPLIALMKDQIDFLKTRGIAAERYDSTLDGPQTREVLNALREGKLKLLYISPERLANERFLQTIRRTEVSLLAVDEAHCISQWGHNFRPEYLKIARTAKELGIPRVLALTATADKETAADIARAFGISLGDIVHTGFYRPNLELHATPVKPGTKKTLLLARLRARPLGPAIVYVTLQHTAEKVAAFLVEHGIQALAYHAGMDNDTRNAVQEAFMASESLVIVATIAFGMGVDKADIRAIYHYNLPKGVESYAQEVGRAGRDGRSAICEVFVCLQDTLILENFVLGDTPDVQSITSFLNELFGEQDHLLLSPPALANRHDIRELVVRTLLTYLELEGYLRALGHIYTNYTLTPNKPSSEMLAPFDEARRVFLRKVLSRCKKKRNGGFSLDIEEAAQALGEPRERILSALEYLEGKGDIDLKASGTRQRFRLEKRPKSLSGLAGNLEARFAEREGRELERIRQMVELAGDPHCLTRRLLEYFGEKSKPCGHCGPCLGEKTCVPPPFSPKMPHDQARSTMHALLAEGLGQLNTPRKLTKFLCGLSSPATSRLKNHEAFGLYERMPFKLVLEMIERVVANPL